MKYSCAIVQDLFVPYLDDTSSQESRVMLEEHLAECEECKKAFECFETPLPTVDVKENAASKKPFMKVRRRICGLLIVIAVLLLVMLPAASYIIYGLWNDFYAADQAFLGLAEEDFVNAARNLNVEKRAAKYYQLMYYTLQERNGTFNPDADFSVLITERAELDKVRCDFEKTEVQYYEEDGRIELLIPLILPDDDESPTVFILYGSRVGCGKYVFSECMLYPKNMLEENYCSLDYLSNMFDTLDPWPFVGTFPMIVEWRNTADPETEAGTIEDITMYTDSGKSLPAGEYICTEEDGRKYILTIYEDRKLSLEYQPIAAENNAFPYMMPAILGYWRCTKEPCSYYITEEDDTMQIWVRYEKTGIRSFGKLEEMDDDALTISSRVYIKSS